MEVQEKRNILRFRDSEIQRFLEVSLLEIIGLNLMLTHVLGDSDSEVQGGML